MPQEVIDLINAQGRAQGMSGLKVTNRQGQLLFNSACLAGVDNTNENKNEENEDEEDKFSDETKEEEEINPNDLEEVLHDGSSQAESTEEDQETDDTQEVESANHEQVEEFNNDTLEVKEQEP